MSELFVAELDARLRNPAWHALTSAHADLAQVSANGLAVKYHHKMSPFCAMAESTPESWAGLVEVVGAGRAAVFAQVDDFEWTPTDWSQIFHEVGTQYVCVDPPSLEDIGAAELGVLDLGSPDRDEMMELTALTQPGPFLPRTHEMGHYIGVRESGRLIAMAGERLCADGFREISAVCVHPDARRRGLAAKLTTILAHEIRGDGATAILHVRDGNDAAHAVYRGIGFEASTDMAFSAWRHLDEPR